ncbi:hypothetical protein J3458_015597 [Metarhizium acridum]|uniref:uncharacterized protein n=1 Tax=Metarhizium acridum TaxID=92637 RepID=UPI001C6B57F7|nr:hypothetical protein J3458_015597 [Metarhizium acridum]
MPQPLPKQKPDSAEIRSATPLPQVDTGEGLWVKGEDKGNKKERLSQSKPDLECGLSRKELLASPHEPLIKAPSDDVKEESGLVYKTKNLGLENEKAHRNPADASNNPEDASIGEIMPCFESANCSVELRYPNQDALPGSSLRNMTEENRLKWGQGEGINMNDLVSHFDKAFSKDDTEETISDKKTSHDGIDKIPIHERCTSSNMLCDQSEDIGGMDANHGLEPWIKNTSEVTRGPSAKDTSYSNEEPLSASSVQLSGLCPTPPPRGDVNLLRPVSLSAVGHPVTTGDSAPSNAQLDIQVGSATVAENARNKSMDNAEKWDTNADFSLNDGAREITDEDCITLGLYDGWPYKLSDVNTGLPPMTEESWRVLETKQTVRHFASDGPSKVDTRRVTAENPSAGTRPLRSIIANVSSLRNMELDAPFKLFKPPKPKPMQQEEAVSNIVDASSHNFTQLSVIPFHTANSKTRTHSVIDTAAHLSGVPEMNDISSPMKDTTKDMPANFSLRKWTGDDSVEPDIKDAKLVSSDSTRLESSSASQDVSFMLWTNCYPDDLDKARELKASTGAPGIRVHSVDVLFRATLNPQVLDEVDAS